LGDELLWLVARHVPQWLQVLRRPVHVAPGCYWIDPHWQSLLWIEREAANDGRASRSEGHFALYTVVNGGSLASLALAASTRVKNAMKFSPSTFLTWASLWPRRSSSSEILG